MTIDQERLKLGVQELLTTTLPQGKGALRDREDRGCGPDDLGLPFHTIGLMFAKTYLGQEPQD